MYIGSHTEAGLCSSESIPVKSATFGIVGFEDEDDAAALGH